MLRVNKKGMPTCSYFTDKLPGKINLPCGSSGRIAATLLATRLTFRPENARLGLCNWCGSQSFDDWHSAEPVTGQSGQRDMESRTRGKGVRVQYNIEIIL